MHATKYSTRLEKLMAEHKALIERRNVIDPTWTHGLFDRYLYPVLTAAHTPLHWRYDLNLATNPYLMERIGVNGAYNAGAIELDGRILLVCRHVQHAI